MILPGEGWTVKEFHAGWIPSTHCKCLLVIFNVVVCLVKDFVQDWHDIIGMDCMR
jgi:hypothetical protein